MSLHTDWIRYGDREQFTGYVAKPTRATGKLPAIIVIQEIWGVDEHISHIARRFAEAGYVAFAPDLYAKNGERPAELSFARVEAGKQFLDSLPPGAWGDAAARDAALAKLPPVQQKEVGETLGALFGGLRMDLYIDQLVATSDFLRTGYADTAGKRVGSVGFCMGGALSALLACHDEGLHAASIFYGNAPAPELLDRIQCPLIGFYGGRDHRITDAVPAFEQELKERGKSFASYIYEDSEHAFFNDSRRSYDPDASRDAYAKVLTFFNQALS
ncbi:MAG: dienelactone hydrolase family protein [Acidibacillus sp.]|uniref:Dienelactone hydrolase domain-containing protein n=1 Tax=Sulfoacidibacillus ferrooxidans TaxID=2005001 RepID=A0A9X1V695_9BACL|nr:dienelactone hydrolase family protein [Sulfoacidibacillus ferrooxidans]MCI0182054.1 hypothetical protein [Sulfoacidibacillus ferrooxidans]MCY0892429.1 dienelactone hydrolase family protein [Acidibacillus sp.]